MDSTAAFSGITREDDNQNFVQKEIEDTKETSHTTNNSTFVEDRDSETKKDETHLEFTNLDFEQCSNTNDNIEERDMNVSHTDMNQESSLSVSLTHTIVTLGMSWTHGKSTKSKSSNNGFSRHITHGRTQS